ncbi:MAG: M12 family metallo-peptidase, partial [Saprospiraceae bacterium]
MNFWFIKLFLPWFAIGIFFNQNADGDLFTVKKQNFRSSVYSSKLKQATLLELNKAELQNILDKRANTLNLKIPYLEQSFDVNLYQIDIFTDHFKVGTSGPDSTSKSYKKGVYYTGTVSNDPGSFISLSFFENELIGMISSKKYGDINIGKLNEHNDQDYIIFNDQDRFEQNNFNCGTVDTISSIFKMDEIKRDLKNQVLESRAAGCVGIDFEVANNIYVAKSSNVTTVTDWLTSLFVHIKTIYTNEQIDIKINYIYIWTTPDSYTKNVNNTSITLNELANLRKSRSANPEFTGNLHHLVLKSPSSTSAAGVAWITSNPLCSDPYRFGLTFLWLDPVPVSLPYYLWDIGSVAHELGHNFGSPHTQSCDWAGGAIDGCVTQEGSCHVGPLPSKDGGTIMSYCHLVSSVGTKLSNGFGPLPGNLIRSTVRTSTCVVTGTCGGSIPLPTCNDGIQNGDETGVDCGGSCGPCGTACNTNLSQGKTTS